MENIQFNFRDQVVIVTGAGQGLGRTVALTFAEAGAHVVATDINQEQLDSLLPALQAKNVKALTLHVDMADSKAVSDMVAEVERTFQRIDVLVNNAGIAHRGNLFSLSEAAWDHLMAVNLRGVWVCSREVLKVMLKQQSGRVVNVGSISGWLGGHEVGADYAVSKAGVAVLTKRMANEMADKGITVNSVAPHALETPMTEAHGEEGKKRVMSKIPVRRLGKKEEVAAAILFLASHEAAFITGQTLHINGGTLMIY